MVLSCVVEFDPGRLSSDSVLGQGGSAGWVRTVASSCSHVLDAVYPSARVTVLTGVWGWRAQRDSCFSVAGS